MELRVINVAGSCVRKREHSATATLSSCAAVDLLGDGRG